jgi:hypothetical protein
MERSPLGSAPGRLKSRDVPERSESNLYPLESADRNVSGTVDSAGDRVGDPSTALEAYRARTHLYVPALKAEPSIKSR